MIKIEVERREYKNKREINKLNKSEIEKKVTNSKYFPSILSGKKMVLLLLWVFLHVSTTFANEQCVFLTCSVCCELF